jgi:hypothetical protein
VDALSDEDREEAQYMVTTLRDMVTMWRADLADRGSEPIDPLLHDVISQYMPLAQKIIGDRAEANLAMKMSEPDPLRNATRAQLTIRDACQYLTVVCNFVLRELNRRATASAEAPRRPTVTAKLNSASRRRAEVRDR